MESDEAIADVLETTESKKALEAGDVQESTLGEPTDQTTEGVNVGGETGEGEVPEGKRMQGEKNIGGEHVEGEHIPGEHVEGEQLEGEHAEKEHVEGEQVSGEHAEGEHAQGENVEGEHVEGEHMEGEHAESEHVKSEYTEGEQTEGEQTEGEGDEKLVGEGEELMQGEQVTEEEKKEEGPYQPVVEEEVEEEYVEEPPPDPTAPYNFSDSQELLKEPFELRPDQMAEVEQLWELYQNYNPAYTDLDGYITEKELIYMLKCLLLMTYTPEQLQELITFCVRPPHPEGHITYEQFLRMVTVRQRDLPVEEELRAALLVLDPQKEGAIDREYLREVLSKLGHKMPPRVLDHLIKEVDISNDGTIGIEDVVGTMCIDLNREDIIMLRQTLFPDENRQPEDEEGET